MNSESAQRSKEPKPISIIAYPLGPNRASQPTVLIADKRTVSKSMYLRENLAPAVGIEPTTN